VKKFKFEISDATPTSWNEVEPIQFPTFVKSRGDINPAITRLRLDGSMVVEKDAFDLIDGWYPSGIATSYVQRWIQYKVSQDISGTYETIIQGYCNADTNVDYNRKQITLTNFSNSDDNYDIILNNYETDVSIYGLGLSDYRIKIEDDAIMYNIHATPGTGLTQANYKTLYTINGDQNLAGALTPDPRWAYFLFSHTIGTDEHVYVTLGIDYRIDTVNSNSLYSYTLITVVNYYISTTQYTNIYQRLWVKLPSSTSDSDSIFKTIAVRALTVEDLIDALLDNIDSSLSFVASTGVTFTGGSSGSVVYPTFDFDWLNIAESKEELYEANLDAKLSLKKVLDWMEQVFDLYWYMDSNSLKFKHRSELATSGTLDLSTETAHLKQTSLQETNLPTFERFLFKDSDGTYYDYTGITKIFGVFEITYTTDFDNAARTQKDNSVDLNTNVKLQLQQNADNDIDGWSLLYANPTLLLEGRTKNLEQSGSTPDEKNLTLSARYMYGFVLSSRYGNSIDVATKLKIGISAEAKPLYKLPEIKYNPTVRLDLFDFGQSITTALGASQAIELRHELSGGQALLTVEL
jgi:hypothetical protein